MMVGYIIKQWKYKKVTIFLIILGFFVASFVLSMGTSISVENIKFLYDANSGIPEEQLEITLEVKEKGNPENILHMFEDCGKYGEIQILNMEKATLNAYHKQYSIVPVFFKKEEKWHVPIIEGRYFKTADIEDQEKQIIIGKSIANKNGIKLNDKIEVNGETYCVIGICGRDIRETQWDAAMYVPWYDFVEANSDYFDKSDIYFALLKSGREEFEKDQNIVMHEAEKKNLTLTFMGGEQEIDDSSVSNGIILTVVSSVTVFVIAIINIVNLMIYWIMERKNELGIMKALGATNAYIVKWIVVEIVSMTFISSILAMMAQVFLSKFCGEFMMKNDFYCEISVINLVVSILVTTICGMIASIIPARQAIKVQLVESIK